MLPFRGKTCTLDRIDDGSSCIVTDCAACRQVRVRAARQVERVSVKDGVLPNDI
jgi:hypothetical protein